MKRLAYLRPRCFDFLPQRSRRRPAARATKINTESLEVRSLLAGNVLASIQAGGLALQGDSLDNDVRIDFDATTFSISGLNGTTINGDASFSRPISEISGVNRIGISLGNGNDSLGVFGTLPERGFVGTTTVDSGAGNDVLFMDGDINLGGDLNINTQAGDDVVVLRGSTVADANIHTGAGNDRVGLLDVTVVDDLFIDASAGADIVGVAGLAVGDKTRVVLGSGDDTLLSDGSFTDENGVAAGSNRFFDRVDVLGGAGNDSFVVTGEHQAVREIVVHGQSGRDAGLLAGVSGNISKVKVRSVRDTVSASVAEGLADQVRDQLTELTAFFGETTVTPPPVVDPGTNEFNEAAGLQRAALFERQVELARHAASETPAQFSRTVRRVVDRLSVAGGLERSERQRMAAGLTYGMNDETGMGWIRAELHPDDFQRVARRLDAAVTIQRLQGEAYVRV